MIPVQTIAKHAKDIPTRVAVADPEESLTWKEFLFLVESARNWLADRLDPARENRVVTLADNTVPLVVATAAVASLGVPWVGVDPTRDEETIMAQVEMVRPTVVVVNGELPAAAAVVDYARRSGALVIDQSASKRVGEAAEAIGHLAAQPAWSAPPFLALGFTSGSTGTPKLFVRRTKSENQRLEFLRSTFGFGRTDTFLVTSPLAHASGHVWANAALSLGATVILGWQQPSAIVDAITRFGVTGTFMVPPTLDEFLRTAQARPDADLTSLRAVLTGGRHISGRTVRTADVRLGPVLHLYYATTETGINTFAGPADLAEEPLTAGYPLPGVRLRVIDPVTRQDLATGRTGLIAVLSTLNLDGYASGSAEFIERGAERYVLTSDYGHVDEAGRLFVVGRSDGLPGDGSVDLVRLEDQLKDLPSVGDVCVLRRAHGGSVRVIALVDEQTSDTSAIATVGRRLGQLLTTQPHTALGVPRIPYNTAGKVDLRALNAWLDKATVNAA